MTMTLKNPGRFLLLPPAPDTCQECAVYHLEDDPHDKLSLFYNYNFFEAHGRWPTWLDALSHCSPATQKRWLDELKRRGVDVEK